MHLRQSNSDAAAGSLEEIERIVGQIRAGWPEVRILLRGDSGFCRNPLMSVAEKSQIQALDRTQPGLPIKKGRGGTMTHDYKRRRRLVRHTGAAEETVYRTCCWRHARGLCRKLKFVAHFGEQNPRGLPKSAIEGHSNRATSEFPGAPD